MPLVAVGLIVALAIFQIAKAPSDSDLASNGVGATPASMPSRVTIRRFSSSGPVPSTRTNLESAVDDSAATAVPRWIIRLSLVGPPEISGAVVEVEVGNYDAGLSRVNAATLWKRKALDIDVTSVFTFATPTRLEIMINHPHCMRIDRSLDLRRAQIRTEQRDRIIELQVQLTPQMIFTGRVVDADGSPLMCSITAFRLAKKSDGPANGRRVRNTVVATAWARSEPNGDFGVPCSQTTDEYLIAASDGGQRTAFWRGRPSSLRQTDIGTLQFGSSDAARLAGRITVGGEPLGGRPTIRLTSIDAEALNHMAHGTQIVSLDDKKFVLDSAGTSLPLPLELDVTLNSNSFDFGGLPPGSYRFELLETRSCTWSFSGGGAFYDGCYLHPDARRASARSFEAPNSGLSVAIPASWLSFRFSTEGMLDDPFTPVSVSVSGKSARWQGDVSVACDDMPDREPLMVASGESYDIEAVCAGRMRFKTTATAPPPGETLTINGVLRRPLDPAAVAMNLIIDIPRATQFGIAEFSAVLSRAESPKEATNGRQSLEFVDDRLLGLESGSTNSFRIEIPRPAPGIYDLTLTFGGRLSPNEFGIPGATLDRACRVLPHSKQVVIPEKGDLRVEVLVDPGGRFVLSVRDRGGLSISDSAISFATADGRPVDFGPLLTDRLRPEADSGGWERHGIERAESAFGSEMIPFLPLPPGRYEVTVSHPDHAPRTVSFLIEAGRDTHVNVVLSPK